MKKLTLIAGIAALAVSAQASAQTAQDTLNAKYDRALAAGYKSLMLCSAIGNAEKNGAKRTPESVEKWELTGIQAPLNDIVGELEYEIVRRPSGQIAHVAVEWDDTMPPRIAAYFSESGCSALPIGAPEKWSDPTRAIPIEPKDNDEAEAIEDPDEMFGPQAPNELFQRVDPSSLQGFLNVISGAAVEKYGNRTRTTAALVMKEGKALTEFYAPDFDESTPQRTWSVAKSIAATFVGVSVLSGETNVNDPVGMNYWRQGGASDPRNALTIDHMLRMASGRYSSTAGNRTDALYWGGSTVNETATNWPLIEKPGTVFRYANNDTLMAVKAIDTYLSYYGTEELFAKLGMNHTVAETDIRGDHVLSSQVWSTARDLAKLGQLYLDNGVINKGQENEERILPENWREYVASASGPQPEGRPLGYGAGFWLMNNNDGIPADTFAALGNRGQYVVIVPSRNVVIVRRGEDPVGARFDIIAFTRDVLAAMGE
ncbi:MAG: serine hydrolase [Erythrobacter sp.]